MVAWVNAKHEERVAGLPKKAGKLTQLMDDVYKVLPDEFDEGAVYDAIKATAPKIDAEFDKLKEG